MNKTLATCMLAVCLSAFASAQSFTFDDPITLGSTQAPDTWYTDRYAPAGFASQSFFDGGNRLKHSIAEADGGSSRPGSFSSAFYNTQGRKYDLNPGTTSMSIDLYVDDAWETSGRRMAGLWGTAFDATNAVSMFPIVEFASDGTSGFFQVWDGAAFQSIGLPGGFAYDSWVTLSMELTGSDVILKAGDVSLTTDANGSTYFGNVILQGHNTTAGVDYDIYWDDFEAVPEPATMTILGLGALAAWRKKKLAK